VSFRQTCAPGFRRPYFCQKYLFQPEIGRSESVAEALGLVLSDAEGVQIQSCEQRATYFSGK